MTTYTITDAQRKQLMAALEPHKSTALRWVTEEDAALGLLQSLQPNTQEPVAWLGRQNGITFLTASREIAEEFPETHSIPLYTHPAPQAKPMTNDELWTVWDDYYTDVASYDRQSFDVAFLRAVLAAAHGVKP